MLKLRTHFDKFSKISTSTKGKPESIAVRFNLNGQNLFCIS